MKKLNAALVLIVFFRREGFWISVRKSETKAYKMHKLFVIRKQGNREVNF